MTSLVVTTVHPSGVAEIVVDNPPVRAVVLRAEGEASTPGWTSRSCSAPKAPPRCSGPTAAATSRSRRSTSVRVPVIAPVQGFCRPHPRRVRLSSWPQQLPCRVAEHVGDGRKNTVTARGLLVAGTTPDADKSLRHAG